MEKFISQNGSGVLDTPLSVGGSDPLTEDPAFSILKDGTCEEAERAFIKYYFSFPVSDRQHMRCCTFTILPAHWRQFAERNADIYDVMMHYLELKKVNGMFTIEFTKRGVPHLHGISPNVCDRSKRFWGASCKIKMINIDNGGIQGWIAYCCKDRISEETNKMFFPLDKTPKLSVYTYRDYYAKFFS